MQYAHAEVFLYIILFFATRSANFPQQHSATLLRRLCILRILLARQPNYLSRLVNIFIRRAASRILHLLQRDNKRARSTN